MSTQAHPLTTFAEFLRLPERAEHGLEQGFRYELHDGEVIAMPPPRPIHIKVQKRLERLLESIANGRGVVAVEFPYRPQPNLQFWYADVAYIPQADWDAMPANDYPVYAPPLVAEVLSPSNTPAKLNRQRLVSLSSGTSEFWVIDPVQQTIEITDATGVRVYRVSDAVPVRILDQAISAGEIIR